MKSADPKPRIGIIVQARMGSSRLPGKILKKILDKPMLEYEIERLKRAKLADEIVLATTVDSKDDLVVEFAKSKGLKVFRGSEDDVLSRYYYCAKENHFEIIVRVTADCPLIDPSVVDQILQTMIDCKLYEYVSNTLNRSFPRGLDCEAFYFKNLERAFHEAKEPFDREHVTPYIYRTARPDLLRNISHPKNLSQHRWTVDTAEDFELIKRILEALYPQNPRFDLLDILKLLDAHPDWLLLNSHIAQKA